MADCVVLFSLVFLSLFLKGAALIETRETELAAVGEEALLGCKFMEPEDVVQVTWQKVLPDQDQNMATYHTDFGQLVNSGFGDKVRFKVAELKNSSIIIRNVVDQDEGCYLCLFNTYNFGAFIGKTCLQVYELHQPVLHVTQSNGTEESVVSCSATGRPAPTVMLSVTQQGLNFSHYSTVSVNNTNATVSVCTTALLSGFHDSSIQVGCVARVLSGPQKEVFMVIPELNQTFTDGFDKESGCKNRDFRCTFVVLALALTFGCVAAVIGNQKNTVSQGGSSSGHCSSTASSTMPGPTVNGASTPPSTEA
ncbi:OX-2 membrane glycoprotein-like [Channa argus]|uniref:OX-2 membrane glycoprotein-like n=1 Tax=Channa argus TaxID=215402 RepID=UPI0035217E9B